VRAAVSSRGGRASIVAMTVARRVVPGSTYLLTRRCAGRRFLLRPDGVTNRIVAYCLARAMADTGVEVHALSVMSNHVHLVVTDLEGKLPVFAHELFRSIAMCIKDHHEVRENVWADGSYSAVRLENEEAVLDKIVYVMANPVAAGLVRTAREWPGMLSLPAELYGMEHRCERPPVWFDAKTNPDELVLRYSVPPCSAGRDVDALVAALRHELGEREKAAAADRRQTGRRVLGAEAVRDTDPFASPSTEEIERQRNPTFAAFTAEASRAAAAALRAWRYAYAEALAAWRLGARDTVFPHGTWWMRVFAGVPVAPG